MTFSEWDHALRILVTLLTKYWCRSGYLLWKVFINIDSYEFPAKNYGDLAYRIYGRWFRWLVNTIQSIQLLLSVGNIIIQNGQSISQVSKFRLCYSVCCLIWALAGYAMGQIRTLNKFTWLANWAVFINLMVMFISMGVIAHSEPNYDAAQAGGAGAALGGMSIAPLDDGSYPPVKTYGTVPPSDNGFIGGLVGLMQGVYAYAGAQLFIEFMAELQRPRDFLKVMWASQFFIYAVYMIYGSYVYYFQGQYANSVSAPIMPYHVRLIADKPPPGRILWSLSVWLADSLQYFGCPQRPNRCGLIRQYRGKGHLQQHPHRVLQLPAPDDAQGQALLGGSRAHLLDHRLPHLGRHPLLLRARRPDRGHVLCPVHLHLPRAARPRVHCPAGGHEGRAAVRPAHRGGPAPRLGREEVGQGVLWQVLVGEYLVDAVCAGLAGC